MNLRTLIAVVAVVVLLGSCKRSPSPEAWSGRITAIEGLNGMTASFVLEDGSRLSGMRVGGRLPPGTRIETQPGVLVKIELDTGGTISLEGGAELQLDRFTARSAKLHAGRAVLTASSGTTNLLDINGKSVRFWGTMAAEVSPALATVAVVEGEAVGDTQRAGIGQVLHVGESGSFRAYPAFDIADRSWFEPRSREGTAGYGRVPEEVELIEHVVEARLDDHFATTTITESFRNLSDRELDLEYAYTLPIDAVLTEVAVQDDDGKWMTSAVEERQQATKTFRRAAAEGRAAVLMSAERDEVRLQVANVRATAERKIRVTYVQPMHPTIGGSRYTYAMPRDTTGALVAERFRIGIEASRPPADVAVYGYGVEVGATPSGTVAEFEAADFSPVGELSVVTRTPSTVATKYARGNEEFLAVTVRPELLSTTTVATDLLVVIDTSDSRRGAQEDIKAFIDAIEHLPPIYRVAFAKCAERCSASADAGFSSEPVAPELEFGGTTNITEVGRFAAQQFAEHGGSASKHVIYVSDGVASAGDLGLSGLSTHLGEVSARLHIADMTPPSASHIRVANAGGGDAFYVDPERRIATMMRVVAATLSKPLTNTELNLPKGFEQGTQGAREPVLPGGGFVAIARGAADGMASFRGRLDAEPWTQEIPLDDAEPAKDEAAAVLWAKQRVQQLEDSGEEQALQTAKTLALEYGVLSTQTSLVAVGQDTGLPPRSNNPRRRGSDYISDLGDLAGDSIDSVPSGDVARSAGKSKSGAQRRGMSFNELSLLEKSISLDSQSSSGSGLPAMLQRFLAQPQPRVVPGRPVTQGSLDKEVIRRIVRKNRNGLQTCYAKALLGAPRLRGSIVVRFTISATGSVVSAVVKESSMTHALMQRCVTAKIRRWQFPEPLGGGIVIVSYPFHFSAGSRPSLIDEPKDFDTVQTIVPDRATTVSAGTWRDADRFHAFVWLQASLGLTGLDLEVALGRRPKSWSRTSPELLAMQGQLDRALAGLLRDVERHPTDDVNHDRIALHHSDVAVACAHRQAAASIRGQTVPDCPMTSGTAEAAKSAEPPPEGEVDLFATITGAPGARLMLVRHDGQRRWWFEPENTTCLVEGTTENCWFDDLPPGIYTLRVVRNGLSQPATVNWRFQGNEHTAEVPVGETYVITIVPQDFDVHPPEVEVPGASLEHVLAAFRPAARFCAAAAGEALVGFEVSIAFEAGEPSPVVSATPSNADAEACLADYLEKLEPIEDPGEEATFYLLVPE